MTDIQSHTSHERDRLSWLVASDVPLNILQCMCLGQIGAIDALVGVLLAEYSPDARNGGLDLTVRDR